MKKASQIFTSIITLVLYLIACGAIGSYAGILLTDFDTLTMMLIAYAAFLLSIPLNIVVHELGHMIFGVMSGYKIMSIRFGSNIFIKQGNGKFIKKKIKIPGTAGQCLMKAKKYKDNEHYPIFWYHVGGGLINIITAAVLLSLCFFTELNPILNTFCFATAVIAFVLAVTNLIPLPGMINDGKNIIMLLTNKNHTRKYCFNALEIVYAQTVENKRQKDIDISLYEFDEKYVSNPHILSIAVTNIERLIDSKEFKEADVLAKRLLKKGCDFDMINGQILKSHALFLELINNRDETAIKALYDKKMKKFLAAMRCIPAINRTEYAYSLLFLKDKSIAENSLSNFEKAVKRYPYTAEIEGERELIAYVEKLYNAEVNDESVTSEICG